MVKKDDKKECDLDCTNIEMYDIIKIFMYGIKIKEDYSMEIWNAKNFSNYSGVEYRKVCW